MPTKTTPRKRKPLLKELAGLGIAVVDSVAVQEYLDRYSELLPIVSQSAKEICRTLPNAPLRLELMYDPEDSQAETLVLYIQPQRVDQSLFNNLQDWNHKVAMALTSSAAWFLVDLDLRRQS